MQDEILQGIQTFRNTGKWPTTISRPDQAYYTAMIDKLFQDKNKLVWVRLGDFNYPRTALYLPTSYRKEAMCEAHDSILGGPQRSSQDLPQDLHLLLLAEDATGH